MATLTFSISTYKIEINQQTNGVIPSNISTIDLSGFVNHTPAGIKGALLRFLPENPYKGNGHQIGQSWNIDSKAVNLEVWFDSTVFAGFYQVLSSEKPVSMKIVYDFNSGASGLAVITSASLLTGIETPGDYEKS